MTRRWICRSWAHAPLLGLLLALSILTQAVPANAQEPIKIGFSVSLTGGLASSGKAHLLSKQIWAGGDQRQGRAPRAPGQAGLLR